MSRYRTMTKSTGILLLLLLLFSIPSTAGATDIKLSEYDLIGTWEGLVVTTKKDKNRVELSVTAVGGSSSLNYNFHYDPPRSCSLKAMKNELSNNTLKLVFYESNGGYCDGLWRGTMILELVDQNQLKAEIKDSSGRQSGKGELTPKK